MALSELEHQGALDEVRQGGGARVAEHGLEEREDALSARRVRRHGKHDARRRRPGGELVAVATPEEQDGIRECLHARRVDHDAHARGEVGVHLRLHARDQVVVAEGLDVSDQPGGIFFT